MALNCDLHLDISKSLITDDVILTFGKEHQTGDLRITLIICYIEEKFKNVQNIHDKT